MEIVAAMRHFAIRKTPLRLSRTSNIRVNKLPAQSSRKKGQVDWETVASSCKR